MSAQRDREKARIAANWYRGGLAQRAEALEQDLRDTRKRLDRMPGFYHEAYGHYEDALRDSIGVMRTAMKALDELGRAPDRSPE